MKLDADWTSMLPEDREMSRRYRIRGQLVERETGRPLADLIVRAFDEDLLFDDKVGFTSTDEEGRFEIRFPEAAFRDLRESAPDLYLKIYDSDGIRLIHETRDDVRHNATRDEFFEIAIPASRLAPGSG
jgi:hypothetical protein